MGLASIFRLLTCCSMKLPNIILLCTIFLSIAQADNTDELSVYGDVPGRYVLLMKIFPALSIQAWILDQKTFASRRPNFESSQVKFPYFAFDVFFVDGKNIKILHCSK